MVNSSSPDHAQPAQPLQAITGFVLAGGQSARMGQDKAGLPWRGKTLLDHIVDVVSTACRTVRVVGRSPLCDNHPGSGPLGGIATALAVATTPRALIIAVDMPLITPSFIQWFGARTLASTHPLVACRIGSGYPICLGIDRSLEPDARKRVEAGILAVREFIDASNPEIVPEEELEDAGFSRTLLLNVNTPADWEAVTRFS
ncbi:MAG TPA: molybdenum cofactor guanylyltransferase [Terriglobia bacterium]|nr:molybdenum cofactor guanylyltransferase [Terriglobia bacterium]